MEKNGVCRAMRRFENLFLQGLMGRKGRAFFIALIAAAFCIGLMFAAIGEVVLAESGKPSKQSPGQTDVQRLVGRWVRPDGGYILELREVQEGGSLKAAYFNPRPIKVSEAVWSRQEGKISVMIELRDVNYPGSTYNLRYDSKTDRLKGTYFQAVEKQTFAIEFTRAK